MKLTFDGRSYTHVLDYLSVPFYCMRFHKVGHVLVDCDLKFTKTFQGFSQGYGKYPSPMVLCSEMRVNKDLPPSPPSGGMETMPDYSYVQQDKVDLAIGDMVVPLIGVDLGSRKHFFLKEIIGEDLNLSASQWRNIEAIWMENKSKWNDSGKYFPSPSHGMVSSTYPLGI
jgi:hypothetical protein